MLFKSFALASLASLALAGNYTFTEFAVDVNGYVASIEGVLRSNVANDPKNQFIWNDGYLENYEGKFLSLQNPVTFTDKGSASKVYFLQGGFLSGVDESAYYYYDSAGYLYATSAGDGIVTADPLQIKVATGQDNADYVEVSSSAKPSSSTAAPVSSEAVTASSSPTETADVTSSAPTESAKPITDVLSSIHGNATVVTKVSSTLVTITSCADTVTDCPLRSTWSPVTWVETYTYPVGQGVEVVTQGTVVHTETHGTAVQVETHATVVQVETSSPTGAGVVTESFVGAGAKQAAGVGAFVVAAAALLA